MPTLTTLGYKETGTPQNFATILDGQQRAYIPDPLSGSSEVSIIYYEIGAKLGRLGSSHPTVRYGIGTTTNNKTSGTPDDRLAYTDAFVTTAVMTGIGGGSTITKPIPVPVIVKPGIALSLVVTSSNHDLGIGMIESAALPSGADNRNFFTRSNGSSIPTNPIAGTAHIEGWLDLWANGVINERPNQPSITAPVGSVASTDLTPNITSVFDDPNELLPNGVAFDYANQVQIKVRNKSTLALMWDYTYTATATERSTNNLSVEYSGLALSAGVDYEVQTRHSDRSGAWSLFSAWTTFNINPGGSVVVTSATPTGKQNAVNPGPFVAQWTHQTPLNAKTARIIIRNSDGSIKYSMPLPGYTLPVQVANGGNISVSYANTAFANLPRGFVGTWEMLAQDTANAWSPASARVPFSINATPNIPSDMSPAETWTSSSLPFFKAKGVDADDLTSALTLTLEIKRADNSTVTRTMTYNATTGYHEYTGVFATDLQSIYQTIQWRVKAGDGTSESAYSAYRTYVYGQGPVVSISSPADEATITTSSVNLAWSVSSGGPQVKRRTFLNEVDGSDVPVPGGFAYDSGLVTTAVTNETIAGLRNGRRYSGYVLVENSTPLQGTSLPIQFVTAFTPPPAIEGFAATPTAINVFTGSDAILLEFSDSPYPASRLKGRYLWRTALGGPEIGIRKLLRRITAPGQTTFLDANVITGVTYEYEMYDVVYADPSALDELASVSVFASASVDIPHVVLASARWPEAYGIEFRAKAGKNDYLNSTLSQDKKKVYPLGGEKGRSIKSYRFDWADSGGFELLSNSTMSAAEQFSRLENMVKNGGTLCLRDFSQLFRFVTVDSLKVARHSSERYTVTFGTTEEYFVEGEVDAS